MASGTDNFNRIQNTAQLNVSLGNIDSGDTIEPYNYLDWKKRIGSISPSALFAAYNQYLRNWYNKRIASKTVTSADVIKQDYVSLLKQLTLSFRTTDETQFLSKLDYTNDIDLAIAVPYFARQLKQIIIYLSTKRESVKATKLKYAMAGTRLAVEKIIYQHLLTAFTKKKYAARIYDPEFYANLPQLSAVNKFLTIQVEELFDEASYADRDIALSLSAYDPSNSFEFVNLALTPTVMDALANTSNYSITATDIYTKYLGTQHFTVSADTDGVITEILTIDPAAPYANLDNRYFPTIASIPDIDAAKSQAEIGGFFTYKNLGTSVFMAATEVYHYNIPAMLPGISYTIPSPRFLNHGRSLTLTDQTAIVIHDKNLGWIKSANTSRYQEGTIVHARQQQKFIPYQSRYETVGVDTQGTARTTDRFDFWTGEQSDIWSDQNRFPLNWRGEFNIDARLPLLQVTNDKLHNWATDIFGNHYSLYKDYSVQAPHAETGVYEKKIRTGNLWIRTASGNISETTPILNQIYDKYATINLQIYGAIIDNNIINMDVVHDILVLEIKDYVLVEHISYDYDNGTITQGIGGGNIISLNTNILAVSSNDNYAGFWFNGEENSMTFCVLNAQLSGSNTVIYPALYKTDLATNVSTQIFPLTDTDLSDFIIPFDIIIARWERPVMSFNKETKVYSIAFLSYNDIRLHTFEVIELSKYHAQLNSNPVINIIQYL